jgi:dTDP-4-dehydrorhamnose 3,5-epimerase
VKFNPTSLPGVFIIEQEPVSDERGAFARFFCADEYREHGLDVRIARCAGCTTRTPHVPRARRCAA